MYRLAIISIFLIGTLGTTAPAIAKNCSSDQKNQANSVLAEITTDSVLRNDLILIHTPFGVHESIGDSQDEEILVQGGYVMAHDHDLRTSLWVTYRLTESDIDKAQGQKRVNCFRKDPRLERDEGASTTDYKEPIYDQGHLANDADLKDDFIQQLNSYIMSNMSPQHCRFNRGIWLSLEHLTRIWAKNYDEIFVTSGAIFDRDGIPGRDSDTDAKRMRSNNGKMRVGVPSHFYKVMIRKEGDNHHAIAFVLEHNNEANGVSWNEVRPTVRSAIVSIAEVENLASVKLHPELHRNSLAEDASAWDFDTGAANFEASCK